MKSIVEIIKKHDLSAKTILRLYVCGSIVMAAFIMCLLLSVVILIIKYRWSSLNYIASIFSICLLMILISKFNNWLSKIIKKFLISAGHYLIFLFELTYSGSIVLFSLLVGLLAAFVIPYSVLLFLNIINITNLSIVSILFISISTSSILSVYCSKILKWIIRKHSPLKDWGEHKYQRFQTELAIYVINGRNINLLICLLYFIYLGISGFLMIQYNIPLIDDKVDNAILKAFLVYLAFFGIVKAYKDKDVTTNTLAKKMLTIVLATSSYSNDVKRVNTSWLTDKGIDANSEQEENE